MSIRLHVGAYRTSRIAHAICTTVMSPELQAFDHESLVEACAQGDRAALHAIYARESRWLLGVAQRIVRDRHTAHDVLHDAFIQIWTRASTYQRALGSARGWIFTIVRHRAMDEARKRARDVTLGDDAESIEAWPPASSMLPGADDAIARALARCLDALEGPRRHCIVFAFLDGYTHDEIATRLGKPVGTVKSWIRRGLLSLKECLS